MTLVPSENWPPYRWLWTRLVLARDPESGEATPYTHGMRRHPLAFFSVIALVLVVVAWNARARWRILAAFGAGLLTGHVAW